MRLSAFIVAACLCAAPVSIAAAKNYVVTESTVAGVGPGVLLSADAALSIPAGETLKMIGPAGPVTVDGPFEGDVASATGAAAGETSAIAALLKRRDRVRRIGASRGGDEEGADVVSFNVLADRAYCVEGAPPTLAAAPADQPRIIALRGAAGSAEIFWEAGATTAPWPDAAPFEAGLSYEVYIGDVRLPGQIALLASPGGATVTDRIAGYMNAGCHAQAEAALTAAASGG
ncbi:MAG: hypothetical protein AAFP78_08785 [Pseudomonadota bacterium]